MSYLKNELKPQPGSHDMTNDIFPLIGILYLSTSWHSITFFPLLGILYLSLHLLAFYIFLCTYWHSAPKEGVGGVERGFHPSLKLCSVVTSSSRL